MTMKTGVNMQGDLQHTETKITLNLGEVLSKIDAFSKGEYVRFQHTFCGRLLSVMFYPKGCRQTTTANATAFFVELSKAAKPQTGEAVPRIMEVELQFGPGAAGRCRYNLTSIEKFLTSGYFLTGHQNFLSLNYLKGNPTITVTATMKYDYSVCSSPAKDSFYKQCEEMLVMSASEGDITLQVVTQEGSNSSEQAPPKKKRKLSVSASAPAPRQSARLQNTNSSQVQAVSLSENESEKIGDSEEISEEVRVSSIVLKAASPVFKRILENNMKESQEKKITVHADSAAAVQSMLYFMCMNELPLYRPYSSSTAHLFSLLKLAHYYEMERLKIACINHIIRQLSVQNFVDVVNTFNQFSIEDGMKAVIEFAEKNRDKIVAHDRYQELPFMFKMSALKMSK